MVYVFLFGLFISCYQEVLYNKVIEGFFHILITEHFKGPILQEVICRVNHDKAEIRGKWMQNL